MTEKIIAKLKSVRSVEELKSVAKELGVELAGDMAKELFEKIKSGEDPEKLIAGITGGKDLGALGNLIKKGISSLK